MNKSSEEVNQLFNNVINKVSEDIRAIMEDLWMSWSHLGVEDEAKMNNIMKIVQIEENLHMDIISKSRQQVKELQEQVYDLKEELGNLSRCLSVDITIIDPKPDIRLVDYKKELEEQIAGYREQMEQRRMKMDRLLEWQRDLSDKLGVTIHEFQDVPLPSEEELNQFKNHLEKLQSERDKRAEIFLNVQVDIKKIMEKLQMQPKHKFEQMVVTDLSVHFKVTDANMERLNKLHQELQEKYEQTNNRLPKIEAQIRELVAQYEAKTGLTFTIGGKPLLQLMEDEWGIRKAVKHR